jgi:Mrp family chromosome partitioning ATPase/capsular polysaccharide biosynthesis protein
VGIDALTSDRSLEPTPLRRYVEVLARRKWVFISVVVIVPLVAALFSLQREALYQAKSQVLLSDQYLGNTAGTQGSLDLQPERVVATQARIARTPDLARRVLEAAGQTSMTADQFLESSDVAPVGGANVLEFSVQNSSPDTAELLASTYGRQFVRYTRELETAALEKARLDLVGEMARLARKGEDNTALYSRLAEEAQQLRTAAALQTSKAQLLRNAEQAVQIEPRPARTAAYALFAALLLGVAAVAVLEALDTRVRSESDIVDALDLQLLGRLPEPVQRQRRGGGVVMLDEPEGADAEAVRILRANIEYANSEVGAQTIMFTSSVRGEGKSTTIANVAVAFARLGRRVALVDLDLRRASVHGRFGLSGALGVTDVARGRVPLDEAIVKVPVAPARPLRKEAGVRVGSQYTGRRGSLNVLEVLPAGETPADPGELVATQGVADVLAALCERADFVFIDAPPVLEVSDPMTLMRYVDALVAVARLGVVRKPMLKELRRGLEASSIRTLGVVITGAETSDTYGPYHLYRVRAEEAEQRFG